MPKNILTQKELKELLHYNPDTGDFIWLDARHNRIKIGSKAGHIRSTTGYHVIWVKGMAYQAHRLAFLYIEGILPNSYTDHINHIRTDNRFINLRKCTHKDNMRNQSLCISNTSGTCGVHFAKDRGKWHAQIEIDKKGINLGYFDKKNHAIMARCLGEEKYGFHVNHGNTRAST